MVPRRKLKPGCADRTWLVHAQHADELGQVALGGLGYYRLHAGVDLRLHHGAETAGAEFLGCVKPPAMGYKALPAPTG